MGRTIYNAFIKPAIPTIIAIGIFLSIIFFICELMNANDGMDVFFAIIETFALIVFLIILGIVLMYGLSIIAIIVFIFIVVLLLKP